MLQRQSDLEVLRRIESAIDRAKEDEDLEQDPIEPKGRITMGSTNRSKELISQVIKNLPNLSEPSLDAIHELLQRYIHHQIVPLRKKNTTRVRAEDLPDILHLKVRNCITAPPISN
jgi:hypothetical protein